MPKSKSTSKAKKPSAGAKKPAARAASTNSAGSSSAKPPLVTKQPQSKQQAAIKNGMFLYTTDAWSLAYFNSGDLHCVEREIFG
jgi:hypothetical protein